MKKKLGFMSRMVVGVWVKKSSISFIFSFWNPNLLPFHFNSRKVSLVPTKWRMQLRRNDEYPGLDLTIYKLREWNNKIHSQILSLHTWRDIIDPRERCCKSTERSNHLVEKYWTSYMRVEKCQMGNSKNPSLAVIY